MYIRPMIGDIALTLFFAGFLVTRRHSLSLVQTKVLGVGMPRPKDVGPLVLMWVVALLASLLSLDRMFQADYEDGSLELLSLAPLPLEVTVIAKVIAHWLTTGLPVTVLAPLLGFLLAMDPIAYPVLVASMLIGTPILSLIGSIGAALTVGIRRGGVLLSLLVMPLYVPALIFGVLAVEATLGGLSPRPHLLLLGADLLVALAVTPWLAAAALRLNLE